MPEAESGQTTGRVPIDAGVFIGALLKGDPRHAEARPLVEQARRVHDARHAAAALAAGVVAVFTYDVDDWQVFEVDGLRIVGPATTVAGRS